MEARSTRAPVAACYGGGALWGIGWALGVARALEEDGGVALADAPALGCSAGAWVAAAMALGTKVDDLATIPVVVPNLAPDGLTGYARMAFGAAPAPSVRVVAVIEGDAAPQLLSSSRQPVAEMVAASSALPGAFAGVVLGGNTFLDGMCGGSSTYIERAADADRLVVAAPLAHPALPGGERVLDALEAEVAAWRRRNPMSLVEVFAPDDEAVAIVDRSDPMALFRVDVALEAERHGRRQVDAWLRTSALVA